MIKQKGSAIYIWGIADLYFILAVTVLILFGVLSPGIQKELHLNSTQLGLLGFASFLSFGATQFLAGSLLDSKGPRITLTVSAGIATIGLFLLSQASGFYPAIIAQVIIGIGFSIAYVGAIYLAATLFPQKQFPLLSGITQMSASGISSLFLIGLALTNSASIDFRILTRNLAFLTLFIGLLLFLIVRKPSTPTQNVPKKTSFWIDLYKLLKIPQFWFGAIYFSANMGVFLAFSSLWNVPDSLAYGHSLSIATLLSGTLRLGGGLGAAISGVFANRLGKPYNLVKWYSSGALGLGILLIYGPIFPTPITFLVMALLGFFFGGTALGFPLVGEYIPLTLKGTGFGLMTSFAYLLSAFLQYLTGNLLDYTTSLHLFQTVGKFKIALTPLILVLILGWICSLKLHSYNKIYH